MDKLTNNGDHEYNWNASCFKKLLYDIRFGVISLII